MAKSDLPAQLSQRLAEHSSRKIAAPKTAPSPFRLLRRILCYFGGICALWLIIGGDRQKGQAIIGVVLSILAAGVSCLIEWESERGKHGDNNDDSVVDKDP